MSTTQSDKSESESEDYGEVESYGGYSRVSFH